jgi:hypothetical protein
MDLPDSPIIVEGLERVKLIIAFLSRSANLKSPSSLEIEFKPKEQGRILGSTKPVEF